MTGGLSNYSAPKLLRCPDCGSVFCLPAWLHRCHMKEVA